MSLSNNNTPLVSIIMTAYNEERYIQESIDSILNQSFTDFELILINDGSTDKTDEIIKTYNDLRIRYIVNKTNLKLIASLNLGLQLAKGKYIARMDADDICFPYRLETQINFLASNLEIGILGSNLQTFGDQDGIMIYPEFDNDIRLHLLTTSPFGNNVVMIRKSVLDKINFLFNSEYIHAEDYQAWSNIIKHTKGYNIQKPLVKYRSHSLSVSNKHKKTQRETRNKIRAEYVLDALGYDKNSANYITNYNYLLSKVCKKKISVYIDLKKKNNKKLIFNAKNFNQTLSTNWYLDSLEMVENKQWRVFINYLLILVYDFSLKNVSRYLNLFKHFLLQ